MWFVLLIILFLFLLGRANRSSAGHPLNNFSSCAKGNPGHSCSLVENGDIFCGKSGTIAAGPGENPSSHIPCLCSPPVTIHFPVNAPPPFGLGGPRGIRPVGPAPFQPSPILRVQPPTNTVGAKIK